VLKLFSSKKLHTAIEIGNSKIVATCAALNGEEVLVKGVAELPSVGIKRSQIVNLEAASAQIKAVVKLLESQVGHSIKQAHLGVSGASIRGFNSHGVVAIKHDEVEQDDIERVLEAAKAVKTPADQYIMHAIAQEYAIDEQKDIREPIGMSGVRLEANVHLVTGSSVASQNMVKAMAKAGLQAKQVVFSGLASAAALVTPEDKELGIAVIDIGAGMTSMVCYLAGGVHHTAVFPCAGDLVTADIAAALKIPVQEAERLKCEHGTLLQAQDADETIEIYGSRINREVDHDWLTQVIEARYHEIFSMIKNELIKLGITDQLAGGIILTGGGALIDGGVEVAEMLLGLPVVLASPDVEQWGDMLSQPKYASLSGILRYCANDIESSPTLWQHQPRYMSMMHRMKKLFQENF
jgi:cell division protein FtsA